MVAKSAVSVKVLISVPGAFAQTWGLWYDNRFEPGKWNAGQGNFQQVSYIAKRLCDCPNL
jgi:hypothetical protein